MPESSERYQRLRAIFEAALQRGAGTRDAYVADACADDAELQRDVRRLLAAHADASSFLEQPAAALSAFVDAAGDSAADEKPIAAGVMVGPYCIVSLVARGGMGSVYRATDVRLRRDVALKVMASTGRGDAERVERFMQEARITASLDHPNIVRAHDVGLWESRPYLITELIEGETLRARLARGAVSPEDARRIAVDLARGLAAAHDAGLVHRDLKPENILITRSNVAKILDFGIAKLAEGDIRRAGSPTRTGSLFGTVGYLAPEQVSGAAVDWRADLFALGSILFEMLVGRRAFEREHTIDELFAVLHEPAPEVLQQRHDVPPALTATVMRLLEKAPDARFQTAADVEAALEQVTSGAARIVRGRHRRRRQIIVASVVTVAVAAALALFRANRAPALTNRDTVLIADFVNSTGEAVFDGTLRQALTIDLEQSPFLSVISRERVRQMLALMTRSPDDRVVDAVAREACQRLGAAVTINGSIAALGSRYLVALEANHCHTGDTVASDRAEAADRDHVLPALDASTSRLRKKLGESLGTLQRFATPIEQATTSSLEALKAFHLGEEIRGSGGDLAAVPFFERAIQLDPDFALAYARLSAISRNSGRFGEATRFAAEAYRRRDRVSELERLYIDERSCQSAPEPTECSSNIFALWKRTYPRDYIAHNNSCVINTTLGRLDEALADCLEAQRLNPDDSFAYTNLVEVYVMLDRLDEAKAVADRAVARKLDDPDVHLQLFQIALALGDRSGANVQQRWAVGRREESRFLALEADVLASSGRMTESHATRARAERIAAATNRPYVARIRARGALFDAAVGDGRRARETVAALADEQPSTATNDAAAAAVLAHDRRSAERLLRLPRNALPLSGRAMLGSADALLEIEGGNRSAVARVPPPAGGELAPTPAFRPIYLRGLAYLKADAARQAVEEFQRILDHPATAPESPFHALARVQQARAYVTAGDLANARKQYEEFLVLWKDADRDVPIFREAQTEYARLRKDGIP
jgi:tetratricopeptide (TPR) repeat protein